MADILVKKKGARLGNDEMIPMIPPVVPDIRVGILSEIQDYNHDLMNIPQAWRNTMGGGVKVAVLDTGMPRHQDMTVEGSRSFVSGYLEDQCGHATAAGSVIAAIANNGMGVKGVAPDALDYYGAVLDKYGTGSVRAIVDGIYWAVDDLHADIINMSLGIPGEYECDRALEVACDYAYSKGVTLFAASGNTGGAVNYPAKFESVAAVAAVDRDTHVAEFSSRGPEVEFAAGGVNVYMCYRNNGYASMSGTSFACPAVAGVACLVKSMFRDKGIELTPAEVRDSLKRMAYDVGPEGRDELYGYGIPVFAKEFDDPTAVSKAGGKPKRQSFWRRIWNAVVMLAARSGT